MHPCRKDTKHPRRRKQSRDELLAQESLGRLPLHPYDTREVA